MQKPKIVKLVSGETIVAQVEFRPKELRLTRPLALIAMPRPDQSGRMNTAITLMEFVPGAMDEPMILNKDMAMLVLSPDEQISELYDRLTNPNHIEVAKPELIV
jgi:hypothetical protein